MLSGRMRKLSGRKYRPYKQQCCKDSGSKPYGSGLCGRNHGRRSGTHYRSKGYQKRDAPTNHGARLPQTSRRAKARLIVVESQFRVARS